MNEGVKAMRREMEKQNLCMPYFITYPDTDEFVVTLVLRNEKLPNEWKEVKKYLEKEQYIDNEKACEITGTDNPNEMSKIFAVWVARGLLKKMSPGGSKKNTFYTLLSTKML